MFKKISALALAITLGLPSFAKSNSEKRKMASASARIIFHNTATVKLKDGEVERYLKAAQQARVMKLTRREPGNISYIAYQSVDNPNLVIFNELWKSKEALDQHLASPHMVQFFTAINFNPALYDIKAEGTKVTFTPKADFIDYVIAELVLDGFASTEVR